MGELNGGMVFDISLGMARRLLLARQREDGGVMVLGGLAEQISFEVAIGRNGKIWVNSEDMKYTLAVVRALQRTDNEGLGLQAQEILINTLLNNL